MVSPEPRARTGSNRKAQLGQFAGYLTATAGVLLGATLLVVSLWRPDAFSGLRMMAADIVAPAGSAGAVGRASSRNVFEAIAGYYRAGSRNAALEREVQIARVKLVEAQATEQENARLKGLLGLKDEDAKPVAFGRLIGSTSASARRFAYLSVGSRQGVLPGMPVVSPNGLVGRVLEGGADSARVLLLTDSESLVPVRRAKDNVVAFAEGRSDGSLRLRLVNLGLNPIQRGDVFVTSGAGGLFRPGVPVAVAMRLTKDGAIGQLLSNPAATDIVAVEPIWQQTAVRALAAPAPDAVAR
ncbi:MAG: rod shape-determining protein MreC [Croceibacterium sp.]